jgi:plasmid stabilization system protein ParE
MIFWEEESLNNRDKIFEFLFDFNPIAAKKLTKLLKLKLRAY